jgi:flavin reductase (DIM6/NTAB) family NADH-FMN oxidoreductase RutF
MYLKTSQANNMSFSHQEFKSVMSLFPTGVAVICSQPQGFEAFGMTVNSFASLSLDPPLVMWNLQKNSHTFQAWSEAETFSINFLKADQQNLSTQFSIKGQHELDLDITRQGVTSCPVLADSIANLECKLFARYEGGDHIIIIGEVVNISAHSDNLPLVFHRGKYATVSNS